MLTLYKATQLTKNIAKWGGIGVAGMFLVVLLVRGGNWMIKTFFPTPAPPPDVQFGKLPPILFPENATTEQFTFQLDTVSGGLGNFPDRLKVYKTVPKVPNLLDLKETRTAAKDTVFKTSETYVTDTEYFWRDADRFDKKLQVNIVSKDFAITSNFLIYPDLNPESVVNQEAALEETTTFLTTFNLFPLDFDENKTTTQLLSLQGTSVFAATSLSTAQLIRIDFFQKDLDKIPVTYPHPPNSTMHFLMGGKSTDEILEASFMHQEAAREASTYPIITVAEAYEILKANKGYLASYFGINSAISIKDVYLAYYIGEEKQNYIMPVYVFSGKDGFYGYIPAISSDWIAR